jgi:hypothetical protein
MWLKMGWRVLRRKPRKQLFQATIKHAPHNQHRVVDVIILNLILRYESLMFGSRRRAFPAALRKLSRRSACRIRDGASLAHVKVCRLRKELIESRRRCRALLRRSPAARARGVHAIAQEIEVKKTADDEIAQRAVNNSTRTAWCPRIVIRVRVQNGWVTLSGEVGWQYQRLAAGDYVRKPSGVISVN